MADWKHAGPASARSCPGRPNHSTRPGRPVLHNQPMKETSGFSDESTGRPQWTGSRGFSRVARLDPVPTQRGRVRHGLRTSPDAGGTSRRRSRPVGFGSRGRVAIATCTASRTGAVAAAGETGPGAMETSSRSSRSRSARSTRRSTRRPLTPHPVTGAGTAPRRHRPPRSLPTARAGQRGCPRR
jgi:hypothetical protein